jgi:hypothetical protein
MFGSAKTTTGAWEIIRHILDTPNGFTLIGCHTVPQLEKTAQKEFFEMFPQELIDSWHKQQRELIAINGHTVIFRPLDDEGENYLALYKSDKIEETPNVVAYLINTSKTRAISRVCFAH